MAVRCAARMQKAVGRHSGVQVMSSAVQCAFADKSQYKRVAANQSPVVMSNAGLQAPAVASRAGPQWCAVVGNVRRGLIC